MQREQRADKRRILAANIRPPSPLSTALCTGEHNFRKIAQPCQSNASFHNSAGALQECHFPSRKRQCQAMLTGEPGQAQVTEEHYM